MKQQTSPMLVKILSFETINFYYDLTYQHADKKTVVEFITLEGVHCRCNMNKIVHVCQLCRLIVNV